jgi:hypothetical protein
VTPAVGSVSEMFRAPLWLAAALAASLVLTACGGNDDADADPTPADQTKASHATDSGPTEPVEPPSDSDLRLALLTTDDVPSGWTTEQSSDSGDDLCDIAMDELLGVDEDNLPQANVVLSADETSGPKVAEGLGLVPSGRGSDVLHELSDALADCNGDEVSGIPVYVSDLDFPTLGDDSASFEIQLGTGDDAATFPFVYAVHGDLLIGVWTYDLTGGDPITLLKRYAPLAVDKAIRGLDGS